MDLKRVVPFLLAALAYAGTSAADEMPGESLLRLDLGVRPFSFAWTWTRFTERDIGLDDQLSGGDGGQVDTSFGFSRHAQLGLGLAWSRDRRVTLGVRLLGGYSRSEPFEAGGGNDPQQVCELQVWRYAVQPYAERAFGTGWVRPFLMVSLGIDGEYGRSSARDRHDGTDEGRAVQNLGVLGLGGGLHLFLGERASVDVWLLENLGVGQRAQELTWHHGWDVPQDGQASYTQTVVEWRTDLVLAFSVWI